MITAHRSYAALRRDLVISCRDGADGPDYVVKDPRARRFFHFGEAEVFLARQLDGLTPLEEIRRRAEGRFRADLPLQTMEDFVASLGGLGLLENGSNAQKPSSAPLRRVGGSLLYLRWRAFDPDRLLAFLVGKFGWLFTPAFVGLSAVLIVLALGITVTQAATIGHRLPPLYRADVFFFTWVVLLAVITCHEFAHGLTCKYFGGHVHEMGFMLIFFQPAMYCNVSDAWLFPEKSKRLWVTFAGAYFELFLWAAATLVWWITDPATLLHDLSLIVMLTSGIKTMINLNPLIRLDGYYLLSDLLNVPNLNRRAFRYLAARLRTWLGWVDKSAIEDASAREQWIFWIYGMSAAVFSFGLLGLVLWRLGGYLTARYQAFGFVAVSALFVLLFRRSVSRTLAKPIEWLTAAPRAAKSRRWFKAGSVLALMLFIGLWGRIELRISAPLTLLPVRHAEVRAEVEGIIEQVLVEEHDAVEAGQSIVRLSEIGYRAELDKVTAEIAAEQARLNMLRAGPRAEEIALTRRLVETAGTRWQQAKEQWENMQRVHTERLGRGNAAVEKAETQLRAAGEELTRIEALIAQRAGSAKELQDATATVALREKEREEVRADLRVLFADDLAVYRETAVVAEKELHEAEGRLSLLTAGSRPEEIEATQAQLTRLETQQAYLLQQIQMLDITSSIAGVITTPKLKDRTGQLVHRGDLIASVHDLRRVIAEIDVPEKEIADLKVGQRVTLKVRAFPGERFEGVVQSLAAVVSEERVPLLGRTVRVTAELDNALRRLRPGMTGHAKIHCGTRPIFDVLTHRLVRYLRVEFWSWW